MDQIKPVEGAGRYRKKPIVVDAIRIGSDNLEAVRDFMGGEENQNIEFSINYRRHVVHIWTYGRTTLGSFRTSWTGGLARAEVGDWIIRGVKGEFYPCKPDVFEMTYEEEKP